MSLKGTIAGAAAVAVIGGGVVLGTMSITTIEPGFVGVQYSLDGGITDELLTQGMNIKSPLNKVSKYSVATEQAYLSRDAKEGSKDDESFNVPTADGKSINVDLEFSYRFDADSLPETFARFRGQSGKTIEETFVRGKMKAWVSEVTSQYAVIDIYGERRSELNADALKHVQSKFEEYGIIIESLNFSRIEVDAATNDAIQARVNKQQELETAKLEAEKAKIEAEKKITQAQADADAAVIAAQGEAAANRELSQSITSELIQMKEAEARLEHGWITTQGANAIVKE
ncbi:MAG: prohibitin family protein [Phocaeicola sp.]